MRVLLRIMGVLFILIPSLLYWLPQSKVLESSQWYALCLAGVYVFGLSFCPALPRTTSKYGV